MVNGGALAPGPEISRVAVSGYFGGRFRGDLELFPFALQDPAVQLEIFLRRFLRVPGGGERENGKLISFVFVELILSARQVRRCLLALFLARVLGQQDAKVELTEATLGQFSQVVRAGHSR